MAIDTMYHRIEITPGVAGGKPHIAGHRITVQDVVVWHEYMGRSADEIATEFDLSLADVYSCVAYYYDHRVAIDESIRDADRLVDVMRVQIPSKLAAPGQG